MLLTDDGFQDAFTFTRTAFRLEAQVSNVIGQEQEDFQRFLAGSPVPPPECAWLRPWLDRLAKWMGEGKTLTRVRVLAEPPTDYQRWLLWGTPWMTRAGEDIRYMRRATVTRIGLSLEDFWLLDSERVIVFRFTPKGEITGRELITDREAVASYRQVRDIALANSQAAETIAT